MENIEIKDKQTFYLVSVDILKGLAIFPMVIGHCLQWYDINLVLNFVNNHIIITTLIAIGLVVFPLFLFIYGFNQTNSFLRHKYLKDRSKVRKKAVKRTLILIAFAIIAQTIMTFVRSPDEWFKLPNYILSWHLFHLFAFSTISLLLMWELAIWLSEKNSTQNTQSEDEKIDDEIKNLINEIGL